LAMRKFPIGAGLTYTGFLLYFVGYMISANLSPAFDDIIKAVLLLGTTTSTLGTIIQVLSGLIGVTGLLLCIASVSKPAPAPITIVQQVPVPAPAPARAPAPSPAPASPPSQSGTCKFCGHYVERHEIFCPSCNRAQR
jgi:hypothetical protein